MRSQTFTTIFSFSLDIYDDKNVYESDDKFSSQDKFLNETLASRGKAVSMRWTSH